MHSIGNLGMYERRTDSQEVEQRRELPLVSLPTRSVEVDVAWTGTGVLTSQSDRFRLKQPGFLVTQWFKGTFRDAAVSGSVAVGGEKLATDAATLADIFRARFGELDVVKTGIGLRNNLGPGGHEQNAEVEE